MKHGAILNSWGQCKKVVQRARGKVLWITLFKIVLNKITTKELSNIRQFVNPPCNNTVTIQTDVYALVCGKVDGVKEKVLIILGQFDAGVRPRLALYLKPCGLIHLVFNFHFSSPATCKAMHLFLLFNLF